MSGRSGGNARSWSGFPRPRRLPARPARGCASFSPQGVETEYKGDVDLVTVADRTAEKLIRERLAEAFPEHGIYGEEGTRDRLEGEFRWYVDPLDGTTNFAHGFPQFCVSLGLEQRPQWPRAGRGRNAGGRGHLRPDARRAFRRRAGTRRAAERQADAGFAHAGAGRGADGHRLSQPQAPREPEYSLLSGVHPALARGAPGRFGRARSGLRCRGPPGRLLGVQPESLGHGGGNSAGRRGGRAGDGLLRQALSAGQPGDSGLERADPRRVDGPFRGYVCRTRIWRRSPRPRSLRAARSEGAADWRDSCMRNTGSRAKSVSTGGDVHFRNRSSGFPHPIPAT